MSSSPDFPLSIAKMASGYPVLQPARPREMPLLEAKDPAPLGAAQASLDRNAEANIRSAPPKGQNAAVVAQILASDPSANAGEDASEKSPQDEAA